MQIRRVRSQAEVAAAAALTRGLYEANKALYHDDLATIEAYYSGAWFLDRDPRLPEAYQPPEGEVLLAEAEGQAVGTVAICRMDPAHCELKSMFVIPSARGSGVAGALVQAAIAEARAQGYRQVRLTTGVRQIPARRLYAGHGFDPVPPWDGNPPEGYVYFAFSLD